MALHVHVYWQDQSSAELGYKRGFSGAEPDASMHSDLQYMAAYSRGKMERNRRLASSAYTLGMKRRA